MKKLNTFLFILIGSTTLVGCNKTSIDLRPTDNEETVINVANSILARQKSPSYVDPDNFVIKSKEIDYIDKSTSEGRVKSKTIIEDEYSCDLKNYLIKDRYITTSDNGSSEVETIYYYKEDNSTFYKLVNQNGLKSKTLHENITKEEASKLLVVLCSTYIEYAKNQDFLSTINDQIAYLKKKQEEYKDKKDEYYQYSFGTNDERSLQLKVENKDKYYQDDLEGYITINYNHIMLNDITSYVYKKSETNLKDETNISYINEYVEQELTYSYGNANIAKPNVYDYIIIK